MAQRPGFSDVITSSVHHTTPNGLDFSRVADETGAYVHGKSVVSPTLASFCSLAPCAVKLPPQPDLSTHNDFLISDQTYRFAHPASMAGAFLLSGKSIWPSAAAAAGAMAADGLIDKYLFDDAKRGKISTFADIASLAIAFVPETAELPIIGRAGVNFLRQSLPVKTAEMAAVHLVAKILETNRS